MALDDTLTSWELGVPAGDHGGAPFDAAAWCILPRGSPGGASSSTTPFPVPPWAMEDRQESRPPVRLRMQSSDMLCRRSMEVSWKTKAGGERQRWSWSSADDPLCSFFEAEKLLPSSAFDIRVAFQVRTVVATWDVGKVDRRADCRWCPPSDEAASSKSVSLEVITFREHDSSQEDPVDAMFELRGPSTHCYVWRAWNSGRSLQTGPELWEHWEDIESRPELEQRPAVLVKADEIARPAEGSEDPMEYCSYATRRLAAAVRTLIDIRRSTLKALEQVDASLTGQWMAVNSANTVSAALGVAGVLPLLATGVMSAPLLLGSALVGGSAVAGDVLADHLQLRELRKQLGADAWNTFATAELEEEWLRARSRAAEACTAAADRSAGVSEGPPPPRATDGGAATSVVGAAEAADNTVTVSNCSTVAARLMACAAKDVSRPAAAATAGATAGAADAAASASSSGVVVASSASGVLAARALGIFGAAVSTGVAVHGWSTTKGLQKQVRKQSVMLTKTLAQALHWLSSMGQLNCDICRQRIILAHDAARCEDSWHCFHEPCFRRWVHKQQAQGEDESPAEGCVPLCLHRAPDNQHCPHCKSHMKSEIDVLAELLRYDATELLGHLEKA
eukprot:TRINITY_DN43734_c0_g2_i1.p1 TRINITY_DN43734_c0_g2~~TRINITY_DN43734_c0_g2_i1.p1  ORF type:complete len:621 (+),score=143.63 TRINITY_DN43734_c0_g2_i1:74-1936(+)